MNPLRLGTVPDAHPYLDAVRPASVAHVRFASPGARAWDRSPLLDADARPALLAQLDVLHVHFGYEGLSAPEMRRFGHDVARAGLPLVVTVHDLRNPHDVDPAKHEEHLGILIGSAAAVTTLTGGAAEQLQRRWPGVDVTVAAHPTLVSAVPPAARRRPGARQPGARPIVGVHLKSGRTNVVDPLRLVRLATDGAAAHGAVLRVDVHEPGADPELVRALRVAARDGRFELHAHERYSDGELVEYLQSLDVSVLPYRFGSHSGWLELCRDLGVSVIAPDCGFYAEQWSSAFGYVNNERVGLDGASLGRAIGAAVTQPRPAPADRAARLADRDRIRDIHAVLYAHAVRARPHRPGAAATSTAKVLAV